MEELADFIPGNQTRGSGQLPLKRATFWQRFFALIIDLVILGLIDGAINLIGIPNWSVGENSNWWPILWGIIQGAIPAIYFILSYSTGGQTLGKRAMQIKVVSMDGSPLNLATGILRTLGYLPSAICLYLGFLWSIWDVEKQTWHDKITGTYVVPVSSTLEQLQGTYRSSELNLKRKRWLLGLGIPVLVIIGGGYFASIALINKGLEEIRGMGAWPGIEISPEEAIKIDLSNLGLKLDQVEDARSQEFWAEAGYERGVVISYTAGPQVAITITALRYTDKQSAANNYHSLQAFTAQAGTCGVNAYAYDRNSGVILCQFSNAYQKLLWNQNWIIVITALEGTQYTPAILANQVREAIAAHWTSIGSP